jgi:hypothetical protein
MRRLLTSYISKSKLAFPLVNESYLILIVLLALKLLRIKPEYFFLGHPVDTLKIMYNAYISHASF